MISRVITACPHGVQALPVTVEADVRPGKLQVNIVGLPDTAIRESKDRLIPAITNSGFAMAANNLVINLSPADLPKDGMACDLPMAVAALVSMGLIDQEAVNKLMFIGELALDGQVRPVRSVLAVAECARKLGLKALIAPRDNGSEAALIETLPVYEIASLAQLCNFLRERETIEPVRVDRENILLPNLGVDEDLSDVRGQSLVKRALEIAAAGAHNILLFGPPGSGKSMLSKRLPGLMPPLTTEEMLEVTRIYSCAGKLKERGSAITVRPFRAPHFSASPASLVGGGSQAKPGESTLAHRGVLFLDELPEFNRTTLESLRQPVEDRHITISRAKRQVTYPCDFLLIAAMNPCPCGWFGDTRRRCSCSETKVLNYRNKISGPLLDRIDLQVETPSLPLSLVRTLAPSDSTPKVRQRVIMARDRQTHRFGSSLTNNANMSAQQLDQACRMSDQMAKKLEQSLEHRGCSARVYHKLLRVARTIADLEGEDDILEEHIREALSYRQFDYQNQTKVMKAKEVTA